MSGRADRAKELFMNGCNCSQAVLLAFADRYGLDEITALCGNRALRRTDFRRKICRIMQNKA